MEQVFLIYRCALHSDPRAKYGYGQNRLRAVPAASGAEAAGLDASMPRCLDGRAWNAARVLDRSGRTARRMRQHVQGSEHRHPYSLRLPTTASRVGMARPAGANRCVVRAGANGSSRGPSLRDAGAEALDGERRGNKERSQPGAQGRLRRGGMVTHARGEDQSVTICATATKALPMEAA